MNSERREKKKLGICEFVNAERQLSIFEIACCHSFEVTWSLRGQESTLIYKLVICCYTYSVGSSFPSHQLSKTTKTDVKKKKYVLFKLTNLMV